MGNCCGRFFCGKWCVCKGKTQLMLSKVFGTNFPSTMKTLDKSTTLFLSAYVAKRISDGKWQAILTSKDFQNGYYLVYRPGKDADPQATQFDTAEAATAYVTSSIFQDSGVFNKAYDEHSTVNVSTVYSDITGVTYGSAAYADKYFPSCLSRA